MSHSSQPSKPMTWPWASFMENFSNPFGSFAPSSLTQPINPGWSFGNVISVTEQNSSAPTRNETSFRRKVTAAN